MRKFILSLALSLWSFAAVAQIGLPFPGPGGVSALPAIGTPVSLGCQVGPGNAQTSTTLTTAAAIPSGTLAVVGVFTPFGVAGTVSSVSDGTNSYTQAAHYTWDLANGGIYDLWYKANASAVSSSASLVVSYSTTTSPSAQNPPVICAAYVSGVISTSPLDKTAVNITNNGTAYSSTSTGTLSQTNEIAFAMLGSYNASHTITEGSGFTNINSGVQGVANWFTGRMAYRITSATTALNYQPSTSVNTYGGIALGTFKGF